MLPESIDRCLDVIYTLKFLAHFGISISCAFPIFYVLDTEKRGINRSSQLKIIAFAAVVLYIITLSIRTIMMWRA